MPGIKENWTEIHSLAHLYILAALNPDAELTRSEYDMLSERILRRFPGKQKEIVDNIISEVHDYVSEGGINKDDFMGSVKHLKEVLGEEGTDPIKEDLVEIAKADGIFMDEEKDFMNLVLNLFKIIK